MISCFWSGAHPRIHSIDRQKKNIAPNKKHFRGRIYEGIAFAGPTGSQDSQGNPECRMEKSICRFLSARNPFDRRTRNRKSNSRALKGFSLKFLVSGRLWAQFGSSPLNTSPNLRGSSSFWRSLRAHPLNFGFRTPWGSHCNSPP